MTQLPREHVREVMTAPRRGWAIALGAVLGLLAAAIAVWYLSPTNTAHLVASFQAAVAPFMEWYEATVPAGAQNVLGKAAAVFLNPWLYVLILVVFLAEKVAPVDRRQRFFSVGMIQDLVAWFILNGVLRVVVIGTFVVLLSKLFEGYLSFLVYQPAKSWPLALQIIVGLLLIDFLNWFSHWLRHKVMAFWVFHAIHHSQRQMNMFTDVRVHLVEYFIARPIVLLPLFILPLAPLEVFWVALAVTCYTHIYHANVRSNYGPLKYFMVTPQSHRIHHSSDPRHRDKNFGLVFTVWDHLFGTQWKDYDEYPPTGVDDADFPTEQSVTGFRVVTNYLRQFVYPFQVLRRRLQGRDARGSQEDEPGAGGA